MKNGRHKTWKSTYNLKMEDQKHENLHTIRKMKDQKHEHEHSIRKIRDKIHEHEHAT